MSNDKTHAERAGRIALESVDVDRLWVGVNDRVARRATQRRVAIAGGVLLAAATLIGTATSLRRSPVTSVEPLALAAGGLPSSLAAASEATRDVRFVDGSDVKLAPGAFVEVLENSGSQFVTALRRGRCTFEVHPGGPRRWVIESGHVQVEVVGTGFTVERTAAKVHVEVDHGIVVVRGERVPDGVQRLTAGGSLDVVEIDAAAAAPSLSSSSPSSSPPSSPSSSASPSLSPSPSASSLLAPSSRPSSSSPDPVTPLLDRAAAAERRGDLDEARRALREVVSTGAGDARSSIAAFSLARLVMKSDPAEAARALETALRRGMPKALEEDARARLVEAHARAGHSAAADAAAQTYLQRWPDGAHRDEVERWRSSP